ncbi:MAG: hypothetical protein RL722_1631, partial [Pseudomonadota bacterium]
GLTLLLGTLLAGCASRPARPDPLETPPLLVAVPGPSGVTTSLSQSPESGPATTVVTLDELVKLVEPAPTSAGPGLAQVSAPAASASPRVLPQPSPLVPARLVEQGLVPPSPASSDAPIPAQRGRATAPLPAGSSSSTAVPATEALAGSAGSMAPPADAASAPARPDPTSRAASGSTIGPLVAPPLPAADAASQAATPASGAGAAGAATDTLEPETASPAQPENYTDLWERIREGFAIADLNDPLVRQHERWYASRPDYVARMTERGSRYLYHIVQEVTRRGMPTELALLPFIESAYNPEAMSVAKASGMWQFIPSTGRNFELKQNVFRDDRRDVLASTRAALDYLEKLHGMFGDWRLALAAYNWGEGNVARAIARNQRARKPTRYENLRMPAETRHYVPKLQAVKNIVSLPEKFGLSLPEVRNHPYFLSVPLLRDIDVSLAARLALMDEAEFRQLNPSFDKPVILAAGTPQILLPYDNADEFERNLQAYDGPLASWTAWQLPRNAKPDEAARLAGISEATLREVNHIPPRYQLKAGSVLLVPRDDQAQDNVSEHLADNAQLLLLAEGPLMRRVLYRAGKGDTLHSVARRYRVAPAQLAQWNHLGDGVSLNAGQQLVVYVPSTAKGKASANRGGRHRGSAATATGRAAKGKAKPHPKAGSQASTNARNPKVQAHRPTGH